MSDYQAGVTPLRLEWVEESTEGQTPSDPSWSLFSDNIISGPDWEPDANTTRQDAAGKATAQGFFNGAETHEVSFTYSLQQWYEDGSNNPQDPGYYFLEPDSTDNTLRSTLSIVARSIQADGGADSAGRRIYTVIKGAHPDSMTVPFETEDGSPIEQELSFQAEKIRQYDISQPSSGTTLEITNNGSTDVDVTIENDDASTSETNTVSSGGGTSTTTATFSEIDVVELSTDVDGTVEVGDGGGTTFVTIDGSDSYPTGEGDLGVPSLGTGSHASALGSSYIRFLDDSLSIPNVESDVEIISGEATVETGIESNAKLGTARQNVHSTVWTYTVTATLAGSKVSVDQTQNYLQENTGTITWDESTASGNSIDWNNSFLQSPGSYTKEAGNGKMTFDCEFEAETVTVSD